MKIASTPIGAAAVLTAIECVGDTAAKLNYPAVTYLTYNALAYVLNDALPTMSMALTNSYWNAMTNVTHLAIGWYLGENLSTAQMTGIVLVAVGVYLMDGGN